MRRTSSRHDAEEPQWRGWLHAQRVPGELQGGEAQAVVQGRQRHVHVARVVEFISLNILYQTTYSRFVAGGHCNTLQCSVVTTVLAFVAERGASNTGGPVGEPAVWFETLAQLAPLPLLSRAVGVGV